MASVQQGEKQLFEKFWRGTFKAVATPRPESIIVASITARKPLPRHSLAPVAFGKHPDLLNLSFLICTIGLIIAATFKSCWED